MKHTNTLDKETQDLLKWYKENLKNEMKAFAAPTAQLITVKDALEMKIGDLADGDQRSRNAIQQWGERLKTWHRRPIAEITYEEWLHEAESQLGSIAIRGGRGPDTGHKRPISPQTVISRFAAMQSVYGLLIKNGVNIDNVINRVTSLLRSRYSRAADSDCD